MAIGVPFEVYYHEDCDIIYAYVEAQRLKDKRENELAWLQGKYNYEAFGVIIGNALRKKNDIPKEYSDEPYELSNQVNPEEAKKKESQRLYNQMKNVVKAFNGDNDDRKKRNLERLKKMNT